MRLFVVHMDGFTPATWRVVSLSNSNAVVQLQSHIRQWNPDYWVLYVGIKEAIRVQERGKLIGIAKADGSAIVKSRDHIDEDMIDDGCFGTRSFRWPTGLRINEAHLFSTTPLPDAKTLIGSQYSTDSQSNRGGYFVMSDQARIEHILALPKVAAFSR